MRRTRVNLPRSATEVGDVEPSGSLLETLQEEAMDNLLWVVSGSVYDLLYQEWHFCQLISTYISKLFLSFSRYGREASPYLISNIIHHTLSRPCQLLSERDPFLIVLLTCLMCPF
jgi:hypothetical protein